MPLCTGILRDKPAIESTIDQIVQTRKAAAAGGGLKANKDFAASIHDLNRTLDTMLATVNKLKKKLQNEQSRVRTAQEPTGSTALHVLYGIKQVWPEAGSDIEQDPRNYFSQQQIGQACGFIQKEGFLSLKELAFEVGRPLLTKNDAIQVRFETSLYFFYWPIYF